MKTALKICGLALAVVLTFGQQAIADFTISFEEVGGDVVGTLSGSVNLDATQGFFGGPFAAYNGHLDVLGAIGSSGDTEAYAVDFAVYTPFGTSGVFSNWDSTTGDAFAFFTDPVIGLPVGYVSGDALSGTLTQNASTFASLGWTEGTHITTFTNNGISDNLVVQIGGSKIPEPTSVGLIGLIGLVAATRRRKR